MRRRPDPAILGSSGLPPTPAERASLERISAIARCNPFLPERRDAERELLGSEYVEGEPFQSASVEDPYRRGVNYPRITDHFEATLSGLRERLAAGAVASERALTLYEDAALSLLYRRHVDSLQDVIEAIEGGSRSGVRSLYTRFRSQWEHFLDIPEVTVPGRLDAPHAFALLFQIHRAYHHIFRFIVGRSMVAARLRAAVWQSIFTHDLRRYGTSLYGRMTDMTTLTADELLKRYCTLVYAQTRNYRETARRLELDRRTVKSRIDAEMLAELADGW